MHLCTLYNLACCFASIYVTCVFTVFQMAGYNNIVLLGDITVSSAASRHWKIFQMHTTNVSNKKHVSNYPPCSVTNCDKR